MATLDNHKPREFSWEGHEITVSWEPLSNAGHVGWKYRIVKPNGRGSYEDNHPHASDILAASAAMYTVQHLLKRGERVKA